MDDEQNDGYAEMERSDEAARKALFDPEVALAFLAEVHGGEETEDCPAPVAVVTVLDAATRPGTWIRAIVRCTDGTERTVVASLRYYAGTMECPPDVDASYEYVEGDLAGTVPR